MQKTVRKIFDTFSTIISLQKRYHSSTIWNTASLDSLQINTARHDLSVNTTVENAFWQAVFGVDPDSRVSVLLESGPDQYIGT